MKVFKKTVLLYVDSSMVSLVMTESKHPFLFIKKLVLGFFFIVVPMGLFFWNRESNSI